MVTQFEQMFSNPRQEAVVHRAWESFLRGDGRARDSLRALVDSSWQRCLQANVDPNRQQGPQPLAAPELVALLDHRSDMLEASGPVMAQARDFLSETGSIMLLADIAGTILSSEGDTRAQDSAESILLIPGATWSESLAGTNAIGTALAVGQPVQIHSSEHFCAGIKEWTCSAMVVRHPLDGDVVGVVDVSGLSDTYNPQSLALAVTTAGRIESRMKLVELERRYRLLDQVLGRWNTRLGDALILFDRRGSLLKANERAQSVRLEGGLLTDLSALRRIPALASGWTQRDQNPLPPWIRQEWLEPVVIDGEHVGTLLAIPGAPHAASRPVQSVAPVAQPRLPAGRDGDSFAHIVSADAGMRDVLDRARLLARSQARAPVLLLGETGVGKEEFASGIHAGQGPYVALNCGGLSRELLVSELFGYTEGAFTGARKGGMVGKVEAAHGGTLFLDEIGEMPPDLQPQLLRVLEQGEFYRLGENTPRKVQFRLIAATHRDLRQEVAAGRFRMDLYYRIAVTTLRIPPLRQRPDDIPALARHFLQRNLQQQGLPQAPLSLQALDRMRAYAWPGNVRELRNVIECAVLMDTRNAAGEYEVTLEMHPFEAVATHEGLETVAPAPVWSMAEGEEVMLTRAVRASQGNLTEAARRLRIAKSTLYAKMERLGLTREAILGSGADRR